MSGIKLSNPAAVPETEPLHFTVHALPRADVVGDEARRRTALGRAKMLLVLLVCAAPVVASYLTFYVLRPEGRSNYGKLIEPSRAVPADLPLTDLDGGRVSAASLKGQWLLVVGRPRRLRHGLRAAPVPAAPVARDAGPRARPHRQGLAGHR